MAFTQIKTNLIANSAITQEKIDPLVELGGGSSVTTSNTAPVSPSSGDMWYNTINGKLYVYYNSNWVEGQSTNQGIGSRVVDVYTASANQVTFTTSSGYTVGYVDVYINGIKILPADFTATNATTVILGEVSDANDEVVIISWTLQPGVASFTSDIFTANGAQTAFTLSTTPSSKNQTSVVIDGVTQVRDTYSVNGSLLTFSETPLSNSVIEVTTARSVANVISYNDLADKPDLTGLGIKISNIQVTDSGGTVLDDTAVDTAGGYIKLTGAGFVSGCQVLINNVPATSVTFVNSTTVRAQVPATAAGTYIVYLVNPDGGVGIRVNGVTFSTTPSWVTGSSLEGIVDTAISIQLSATGASTYTLQAGSTLPTGLTLTSGGLLSGTITGLNENTIYNFTILAIDTENQDSPRAFSITITVSDPNFKSTVLAINADVNTFVRDASSNNFPVTITGDTRPSAFSPYNTNWSNFFDGTGDYLGWSGSTLSGDFTVECWVYKTAVDASGYTNVFTGTGNQQLFIDNTTAGSIGLIIGGSVIIPVSGTAVTLNAWHHLAWVREGSTCRAYVNGVQQGTGSSSASVSLNVIGRFDTGGYEMNGYISNARIVNGTCLYPSGTTFTVPTSPLTAVNNTHLLTCQSNRIIDTSSVSTPFTITKYGDVKVTAFGPFTETDTTTGSGYFDGTGDNLQVVNNAAFQFGSENFTIEFFAYFNSVAVGHTPLSMWSSSQYQFSLYTSAIGVLSYYLSSNGTTWNIASGVSCGSISAGQWIHVALVRNGSTFTPYLNGVAGTTTTSASALHNSTAFVTVGSGNGVDYFNGHISNVRIIKGTAVYNSSFTPPILALTAVANTSLLTLQTRQPVNNHSFIDHSGNNNLITRAGNASQGSFSPYSPAGWSNYFNNNPSGSQILFVPDSDAFNFGSGDFTVEAFIYRTSTRSGGGSGTGTQSGTVYAHCQNVANNGNRSHGMNVNDSTFQFYYSTNGSTDNFISWSYTFNLNQWYHVAISRSGNLIYGFVGGQLVSSQAFTATIFNSSASLAIGGFGRYPIDDGYTLLTFGGYISNLRLIKGTAVYTSAFTSPTTHLTAITNTSLLTCQNNRFIDNSTNNFTITKNGDARVVNFSPFAPTASYSPAIHGGSAYFDGSDYVTVGQGFNTSLGTRNWTAEGWIYLNTSSSTNQYAFWHYGSTVDLIAIYCRSDTGVVYAGIRATNLTETTLTGTTAFAKYGQWVHVALVRESTTSVKLYTNGVLAASVTIGATASFNETTLSALRYGAASNPDQLYMTGYLSDWRFVKGRAVYTGAFTPPISSLPFTADAVHQLEFNSAGIVDVSSRNVLETVGDAKIRTDVKKYGTGSVYFDGTGDYLKFFPDQRITQWWNKDYTIEAWINPATYWSYSSGTIGNLIGHNSPTTDSNYWSFGVNGSGQLIFYYYNGGTVYPSASSATITLNQWNHVAFTHIVGSGIKLWVNGVGNNFQTVSGTPQSDTTTGITVGAGYSSYITGYIDDLRITTGVARYTANFTPPTSTFIAR
jgi:hypothetical protein